MIKRNYSSPPTCRDCSGYEGYSGSHYRSWRPRATVGSEVAFAPRREEHIMQMDGFVS